MNDTKPESAAIIAPMIIATAKGPRRAWPFSASTAPSSDTPRRPPARDKALLKPETIPELLERFGLVIGEPVETALQLA